MTKKKVDDGMKWADSTKTRRIPRGLSTPEELKGNKRGVNHGRPPNPGFDDESLKVIGKELLQWMHDNKNNTQIVHLSQFYLDVKDISPRQWDDMINRACFSANYDKARAWMGRKLLQNKDFPQSYGNRFLGIYFKEIRKDEDEVKDRQAERDRGVKATQDANLASLISDSRDGKIKQDDE